MPSTVVILVWAAASVARSAREAKILIRIRLASAGIHDRQKTAGKTGAPPRGATVMERVTEWSALLLPTAAQRVVELDKRKALVQTGAGQVQLGREIIGLVGQHFQIARRAAAIAHFGKIRRALRRGREQFLVLAKLAVFRVGNQRIGNLAERGLNGLLISRAGPAAPVPAPI